MIINHFSCKLNFVFCTYLNSSFNFQSDCVCALRVRVCVHVCVSIETGSPALDEFLELIGQKVRMKGFTKYRAQLDNKSEFANNNSFSKDMFTEGTKSHYFHTFKNKCTTN